MTCVGYVGLYVFIIMIMEFEYVADHSAWSLFLFLDVLFVINIY